MNEERIIIDKKTVLKSFDKAGDPMSMWCILRGFGKEAPPEDWQDYYHKVSELTIYVSELGDGSDAGRNTIDVTLELLKDMPSKEVVRALYEDAKKTHRSVHSLTDLAFQSAIQIRLLRKLYPWLESENTQENDTK